MDAPDIAWGNDVPVRLYSVFWRGIWPLAGHKAEPGREFSPWVKLAAATIINPVNPQNLFC